jgi:hypothetical protein
VSRPSPPPSSNEERAAVSADIVTSSSPDVHLDDKPKAKHFFYTSNDLSHDTSERTSCLTVLSVPLQSDEVRARGVYIGELCVQSGECDRDDRVRGQQQNVTPITAGDNLIDDSEYVPTPIVKAAVVVKPAVYVPKLPPVHAVSIGSRLCVSCIPYKALLPSLTRFRWGSMYLSTN